MTEHLPECPVEKMLRSGRTVGSQSCICEHLRACEERVEESIDRAWQQAAQLAVAHARTATLDAAREAVAATVNDPNDPKFVRTEYQCCGTSAPEYMRDDALDAIDALRRKEHDEAG